MKNIFIFILVGTFTTLLISCSQEIVNDKENANIKPYLDKVEEGYFRKDGHIRITDLTATSCIVWCDPPYDVICYEVTDDGIEPWPWDDCELDDVIFVINNDGDPVDNTGYGTLTNSGVDEISYLRVWLDDESEFVWTNGSGTLTGDMVSDL